MDLKVTQALHFSECTGITSLSVSENFRNFIFIPILICLLMTATMAA